MAFHGAAVDDLIGPTTRLLFVGINPSLWTAAVNAHFARRGNRFWPALAMAGIVGSTIDASDGMSETDEQMVFDAGIGITNIVSTATARADELTNAQLRSGGERLTRLVAELRPQVVALLGVTAYRQAFGQPNAQVGRQPERFAVTADFDGSELWVLPNPSGLNAHETLASLATAYRQAAVAAGVVTEP